MKLHSSYDQAALKYNKATVKLPQSYSEAGQPYHDHARAVGPQPLWGRGPPTSHTSTLATSAVTYAAFLRSMTELCNNYARTQKTFQNYARIILELPPRSQNHGRFMPE
jgi:hypothetical protein